MTSITINDADLVSLKDQVVVLTGGSSGIGLATVKLLSSLGAKVVVGDLNALELDDPNVTYVHTNVTAWQSLLDLFKEAKAKHGKIDCVFANAGIRPRLSYLEDDTSPSGDLLEPDHTVFDVNIISVINTVKLAIHHLKSQPTGGSIVITGSSSSFQRFSAPDYSTSKHAVLGLFRSLQAPLANLSLPSPSASIRLNLIAPSWTETGMVPSSANCGLEVQPPSAVARAIALLFADEQRKGEVVYVEGGRYWEVEEGMLGFVNKELLKGGRRADEELTILKAAGSKTPA